MKNLNSESEYGQLRAALSAAFAENKSVRQLTGDGPQAARRRKQLMDYAIQECKRSGKVLSDDSGRSFALVIFPDRKHMSLSSLFRDLKVIFQVTGIRRTLKAIFKEKTISGLHQAHFGSTHLYYVWFIGTETLSQGRGFGTTLLRELLLDASSRNRQLILETSTEANLAFYWKAGLECYETLDIGFPLYCFRSED